MPSLTSELFVRLLDGVTKPAAGVSRALLGIGKAQQSVNGRQPLGERMAAASERNAQALNAARGGMVDAAAAAYLLKASLEAPITSAMNFETQLEDIGQKADIPQNRLAALGAEIKSIGLTTNQSATEIGKSIDTLVGMGASEEVAKAAAAPIGQAATAYRASTEDLANAAYAAVTNLKVPADQIGSALDKMAQAGKEGAFELRDMAKYFPTLGAAYQGLGQKGVPAVADLAAALQAVRKGTGDSQSAATNLGNILQKVYAPDTIKNFKKQGIDLRKEMKKLQKQGQTPIEAISNLTNKALKGDLSKIGDLFQDSQVQQGLRALIQNLDEYKKIRKDAMDAQGVVADDYARRMKTSAEAAHRFSILTENLSLAIGSALLPQINELVTAISPAILAMTRFAEANPELTRNVIATTAGLVGLRIAAAGVRWAFLFMRGGALGLATPIVLLGTRMATAATSAIALQAALGAMSGAKLGTMEKIGVGLRGIVADIPLIGPAIGMLGGITLPVVAAAVAVAGLGLAVWTYRKPIITFAEGVATSFQKNFPAAAAEVDHLSGRLDELVNASGRLGSNWAQDQGAAFGDWVAANYAKLGDMDLSGVGEKWADSIFAGIKNGFQAIMDWFAGLGARIVAAVGKIDIMGNIHMPSFISDLYSDPAGSGAVVPPPVPEARANGGPVQRGKHYVVGDGGEPEFFSPGRDGYITPFSKAAAGATGGGAAAGQRPGGTINFNPAFHVGKVVGVDDLDRRLAEFARQMHTDFEQLMNGSFSDAETA